MRVVGAVVAVVLAGTLLAGCQEEPAAKPVKESPKLSASEFLQRGNEICRKGNAQLDRDSQEVDTSTPAKAQTAIRSIIVPNIREQVSELRGLRGPAELERQLTPVLDETDRLLDFIAQDPTRYAQADTLFAPVNKDLNRLGLSTCGSTSS